MKQRSELNCWIEPRVALPSLGPGRLSQYGFAVKDNFAIAGYDTGCGCPAWIRTHDRAEENSAVLETLLASGAKLLGRCVMDEMAYGIEGKNFHLGIPINSSDPQRFCGGSSCGCASAVAGAEADFGMGTDTAGSVRIPASWCGIFGFRPSHGWIQPHGVVPLAPGFDTVGWMARELGCLEQVSMVLLERASLSEQFFLEEPNAKSRLQSTHEPSSSAKPTESALLLRCLDLDEWDGFRIHSHLLDGWSECLSRARNSKLRFESFRLQSSDLREWWRAFAILQGREIIETHHGWLKTPGVMEELAPWIKNRLALAMKIEDIDIQPAQLVRESARNCLNHLFRDGAILCMPTTPGPAPLLSADESVLLQSREETLKFSCLAALAGCPELTMPGLQVEGGPVGISLITAPGRDLELVRLAQQIRATLLNEAST